MKKITRSNFFIRAISWEYWPFGVLQFPVFFYFLWLALRARSLVFFSAANPGITMGGLFGESKYDILEKIPDEFKAKTIRLPRSISVKEASRAMATQGFRFPVIFKPDLGERGFMVKRIDSTTDVAQYLGKVRVDFLVQEMIDLPHEFGVFYRRYPHEKEGRVISIVMKEMLTVTGNGRSTLHELIMAKDRAKLQWSRLKEMYESELPTIIPAGQTKELISIGNHALGTKFLNGEHLINDRLSHAFDRISKLIPGFYFGRFDLRCASVDDLTTGKVKILELNGCGAEPAHIYDPQFPFFRAVAVLLRHWKDVFDIARENHRNGASYTTFSDGWKFYRKFKAATQP